MVRLLGAFLIVGLLAAQAPLSYPQLRDLLKSSIDQRLQDKEIAKYLGRQQLGFELTDVLIEGFQGWGIGPRTLRALRELQPTTQGLAAANVPAAAQEPE